MSTLGRQEAYDEAVAVFGPKVRFVEWKMYEVDSYDPPYFPFDLKGIKTWDTWTEIEGARWIYAFRRPASDAQSDGRNSSPALLVDELYLDEHGKLFATDGDKLLSGDKIVERDDRGKPAAIGDSVSFMRQLFGVNFDYWFFGARIRLPAKTLQKIMNRIPLWTSRTHFWPEDPNMLWGTKDDVPLVPIVDPITIARYLHAYYISAANDLMKYLTPVEDPDDRDGDEKKKRAAKRQKKLQVAQIVDALLDADNGNLGTRSKVSPDRQAALFDFLTDYTKEVQYRTDWRDRWAKYLAHWLGSEPITLLADAYLVDEKNDFPSFFLEMALCHHRLSESTYGRELLEAHFADVPKWTWVHKYVFGRGGEISSDLLQGIRKLGSAPLEIIKEHVPVWMSKTVADEINEHLEKLFGLDHEVVQTFKTASGKDFYMAWVKEAGKKDAMKFGEIDSAKIIAEHDKELKLTPMWHGAVTGLAAGIELINFGLKLRSFEEKYDGEDRFEKVIAFVDLVGGGLDLASAGMAMLKVGGKKLPAVFGFVSAAIDTVLSGIDAAEALGEGKIGQAVGSGVISVGSLVLAAGFLLEAEVIPGAIVVVAIGYLIKVYFADDNDYQLFVAHSAFGDSAGSGEDKPGWYKTDKTFAEWSDDLDEQLRAAVMLLCKFAVDPDEDDAKVRYKQAVQLVGLSRGSTDADAVAAAAKDFDKTLRGFELDMGWLPPGAKLEVVLSEVWKTTGTHTFKASIDFATRDPKVSSPDMTVDTSDLKKISVHPNGTQRALYKPSWTHTVDEDLLVIAVAAWLTVEIQGKKYEVRAKDATLYKNDW
ncbi:MAG TPA: hypothetical protein VN947_01455 [Polyangia bacterium]|nr:hypothetical protein [Polyangia bacterium]